MGRPETPMALYQRFFGLRENPFNLTPDPRFIFWSRAHREALAHLLYGINERKGFIELTGEIGTGKTLLCRYLVSKCGKSVKTAVLFNPALSEEGLMRAIIEDFGISGGDDVDGGLLDRLNGFLLHEFSQGRNAALFIDECQNLSSSLLEQIRLISNLETDRQKLIQIIMVGQPELKSLLRLPSLAQLNQRISVRYHLGPFGEDEVASYIYHRLRIAGARPGGITFTTSALARLYALSQGIPRTLNIICDRALLAAYSRDSRTVTHRIIDEAAEETTVGFPRRGGWLKRAVHKRRSLRERAVLPLLITSCLLAAFLIGIFSGLLGRDSTLFLLRFF